MYDPLVIIIDPLKSTLRRDIDFALTSFKDIRCLSLDINDLSPNHVSLQPRLILILLDVCNGENIDIIKLQDLPKIFVLHRYYA